MKSAVLFLVFNRPDTTRQVFEAIRKAKPPRLYVAADGPRSDRAGEKEKCEEVRRIATAVDWDCEVKTLFREKNLGCKIGVSSGIDWFFEHEEEGIILEDDVLPVQSFFPYCDELLERYRGDMRVWLISGNNQLKGWVNDKEYSYYFGGVYGSIWGWASWRNRWLNYDVDMKGYEELKDKKYLENAYGGGDAVKSRLGDFKAIKDGLDTWDFQWVFARWCNAGLTINPTLNMISNLGFVADATHTTNEDDSRSRLNSYEIKFPLRHPLFVMRDVIAENKFYSFYGKQSVFNKVYNKLIRVLRYGRKN